MNNTLLTITGPSLSGKSTLEKMLHEKYAINKITSFTTRPPREGEVDGQHYFFLDRKEAERRIAEGEMAEWVEFQYHLYGILGSELESKLSKGACIAVVEPRGLVQMAEYCKEHNITHRAVFLANPPEVLAARFLKRFKDNPEAKPLDYTSRMVNLMKYEQDWVHSFEYHSHFFRFDSTNEDRIVNEIFETHLSKGICT
jgi:guanylate kinase